MNRAPFPVRPLPLARLGLGIVVLIASGFLLSTCGTLRPGGLREPVELFVVAGKASDRKPIPYLDDTGAISGFVSPSPDLVIDRVDSLIVETRDLPVFEKGRVVGTQPHRVAQLHLHRREGRRLRELREQALGRVLLVRMNEELLTSLFVTEPLDDSVLEISGPADDPRIESAIRRLEESLTGKRSEPAGGK